MASYNKITTVTQNFGHDEYVDLDDEIKPIEVYTEDLKALEDLIDHQRLVCRGDIINVLGRFDMIRKCDDYGNIESSVETGNDCRVTTLHIGCYVQTLRSSFFRLDALETLHLEYANWVEFPFAICNLKNLKRLFLPSFQDMELPAEFWDLTKLEVLRFRVRRISRSIGKLVNLRVLICLLIPAETFPEEIGMLPKLEELKICSCRNLSSLPNSIGDLANLKSLWMLECNNIQSFPKSFGNLTSLEVLRFEYSKINSLPESLGLLTNLKELILPPTLKELPKLLWKLTNLKYLNLAYTALTSNIPDTLKHLRPLKSLQFLILPNMDTDIEANWVPLPELAAELPLLGYIDYLLTKTRTQNHINKFNRLEWQLGMNRSRLRISGVAAAGEYKEAPSFPPMALWPSILSKADAAFAYFDPVQNLEPIVSLYPNFHRHDFPGRFGSPDHPFSKSNPEFFFSAYENAKYSRKDAIYQLLQEYGPCVTSSSLDKTTSSK